MKTKTRIKRHLKKNPKTNFVKAVLMLFALNLIVFTSIVVNGIYTYSVQAEVVVPNKEKEDVKEYVRTEIEKAGLKWSDVECLVRNESGWNEYSLGDNKNGAGVDRGLFQFSSIWHKEISNKEAFDYKESTKHFIRIVKQDKNYHQWYGYANCK